MSECPPLQAVRKFGKKYPTVWDDIDDLVHASRNGEVDAEWDFDLCYAPVSAAIAAMTRCVPILEAAGLASFAAALAAWRRNKLIYQFDEYLADELVETASDLVIPIDILEQLPAPCIFVSLQNCPQPDNAKPYAGFFVHIEHDVKTHEKELRMHHINTDGEYLTQCIVHLIPGGTINDGIDEAIKTVNTSNANVLSILPDDLKPNASDYLDETREFAVDFVQLVLYICAENADITENESQAKIYRKPTRTLDKFREIRQWDVGVKVSNALRAAERQQQSREAEPRQYAERKYKNRPHVRRAHWHHFWTGSGDNKKLILRWVNTSVINSGDGAIPATIVKLNNPPKNS